MRHDIHIQQGADWSFVYTHKDSSGSVLDVTGYSARASIKIGFGSSNMAYLSSGSDANGGTITVGGTDGKITMSMTAEQTAALLDNALDVLSENYVAPTGQFLKARYQLELLSPAGTVTRPLEGNAMIDREITT